MGDENDIGGDVIETEDGYVISGLTTSDEGRGILLIKTDLEGEEMWRKASVGGE